MTTYTKCGNLHDAYSGAALYKEPHVMFGHSETELAPTPIVSIYRWPDAPNWYKVRLLGVSEWLNLPADTNVYTAHALIDWMDTGRELVDQAGGQAAILTEIAALSWHALPCSDVPAMQGLALGHLIKKVVTGKVHQIAWDGVLCNRYGLIGIEAEYTNGSYRHYWADTGTGLTPLVSVKA